MVFYNRPSAYLAKYKVLCILIHLTLSVNLKKLGTFIITNWQWGTNAKEVKYLLKVTQLEFQFRSSLTPEATSSGGQRPLYSTPVGGVLAPHTKVVRRPMISLSQRSY